MADNLSRPQRARIAAANALDAALSQRPARAATLARGVLRPRRLARARCHAGRVRADRAQRDLTLDTAPREPL